MVAEAEAGAGWELPIARVGRAQAIGAHADRRPGVERLRAEKRAKHCQRVGSVG